MEQVIKPWEYFTCIVMCLHGSFIRATRSELLCNVLFSLTVNVSKVQRDDFHPKPSTTVQSQMSSSGTKSPQVAVIPPLVDLTKVSEEGKSQDNDDKSNGKVISSLFGYASVLYIHFVCTCCAVRLGVVCWVWVTFLLFLHDLLS